MFILLPDTVLRVGDIYFFTLCSFAVDLNLSDESNDEFFRRPAHSFFLNHLRMRAARTLIIKLYIN